jgi:alkylated DNA repair dioxygenase AlkB
VKISYGSCVWTPALGDEPLFQGWATSVKASQLSLLDGGAVLPAGFKYQPELLSTDNERELVGRFAHLRFKEFEFQGYVGRRRVLSFGWKYDFNKKDLQKTDDIPAFLVPIRDRAAEFARLVPDELEQVLVTEYAPGAGIGWHKDKSIFGDVVGISIVAACVFRLRRKIGETWQRASLTVQPRSAYLLRGASRIDWEHSIPPLDSLRYSITFRTFRLGGAPEKSRVNSLR